jgi:hypothetical protein
MIERIDVRRGKAWSLRTLTVVTALWTAALCGCATSRAGLAEWPPAAIDPATESLLPVFVIPAADDANGPAGVFVEESRNGANGQLEITVVFVDEDHPSRFVDGVYDFYRRFKYGRVADVETFFIEFDPESGVVLSLRFDGTYAGDQPFDLGPVTHLSAQIDASRIELYGEGQRPVIYVTTWNHLFRETPLDLGMETIVVDAYPLFGGDRELVETCF